MQLDLSLVEVYHNIVHLPHKYGKLLDSNLVPYILTKFQLLLDPNPFLPKKVELICDLDVKKRLVHVVINLLGVHHLSNPRSLVPDLRQ